MGLLPGCPPQPYNRYNRFAAVHYGINPRPAAPGGKPRWLRGSKEYAGRVNCGCQPLGGAFGADRGSCLSASQVPCRGRFPSKRFHSALAFLQGISCARGLSPAALGTYDRLSRGIPHATCHMPHTASRPTCPMACHIPTKPLRALAALLCAPPHLFSAASPVPVCKPRCWRASGEALDEGLRHNGYEPAGWPPMAPSCHKARQGYVRLVDRPMAPSCHTRPDKGGCAWCTMATRRGADPIQDSPGPAAPVVGLGPQPGANPIMYSPKPGVPAVKQGPAAGRIP